MSSIKTTQIDGDVSVGRNVAMGGKATVAGSVTVGHNLKVSGWLEAPNVKGINKGIYQTVDALQAAYPTPRDGWLAGVGTSSPFDAYIGNNGVWTYTGGTIAITIDLTDYATKEDIEDLEDEVEALEASQKVKLIQTVSPSYVVAQKLIEPYNSDSTAGYINAPASDFVDKYEVWYFPVEAGQTWHIVNTHPSGASNAAAVYAIYGGSSTLAYTDCTRSNALWVSNALNGAIDTDTDVKAPVGSVGYNPNGLSLTSPLTMPENAQWLVVTRYKPSTNADVITAKKDVYISPTTAYENLQAAKADLEDGVLKETQIPYAPLDARYMANIAIAQTPAHTSDRKLIECFSSAGDISTPASGYENQYEVLYFKVSAGEAWRIVNTHPSNAGNAASPYAIYGGSSTLAYTDCARENALWVSAKYPQSAIDTDVDLNSPTPWSGYDPDNLGLTHPLIMPSNAQWLVVTRYKPSTAPDVVTATKTEIITPTEVVSYSSMKVKRDGENVLVAYNNGGTELLYTFGRCFNSGEAINNTLGLAEVGYRRVGRSFPVAAGTATMLCHQHYSDMIGPVEIFDNVNYYFCGGAHQIGGQPTASTINDSWHSIKADGNAVADGDDLYCHRVELVVVNKIQCPDNGTLTDCLEETITMTVVENRMKVHVNHDYKYSGGVGKTLSKYYGMQSMFGARNTNKIMTPDGKFPRLISQSDASDFKRADYPNFNRFIQRKPDGWCQSSWINKAIDIGENIHASDYNFRVWDNKVYHFLISSQAITSGLTYEWEGVYSWEEDKGPSIAADLTNQ